MELQHAGAGHRQSQASFKEGKPKMISLECSTASTQEIYQPHLRRPTRSRTLWQIPPSMLLIRIMVPFKPYPLQLQTIRDSRCTYHPYRQRYQVCHLMSWAQ